MARFSAEFFAHVEDSVRGLAAVSGDLTAPEVLPRALKDWFTILWHAIRATSPLFDHAVARLASRPDDEFHRILSQFYRHKIEEETGHDQMLRDDLVKLGATEEQLTRSLAPAPVAAMIGSQYYLIDFCHPCSFLGYLALFEGHPLPLPELEHVVSVSKAPADVWSTYRMHAEVDPWHREELEEMLDRIPNDSFLRGAIVTNGLRSAEYYCQALEELRDRVAI
jgi:hypothetical protein